MLINWPSIFLSKPTLSNSKKVPIYWQLFQYCVVAKAFFINYSPKLLNFDRQMLPVTDPKIFSGNIILINLYQIYLSFWNRSMMSSATGNNSSCCFMVNCIRWWRSRLKNASPSTTGICGWTGDCSIWFWRTCIIDFINVTKWSVILLKLSD